ncbi:CocE/NonD family hydrolase [Actinomycetospora endophytica]|uniref:CocE/NonD family hydrolase n=1 Tax=Actinomycetospora endophytica TaxID=2291215 RepID=A0ABS8P5F5_9PSEU|nr:CocE/NonD family hydrolase [Actinomycetospora endophytica]MCD2193162.1 CocE/NonD family hydrolase [Actinomycetospora endophytica]
MLIDRDVAIPTRDGTPVLADVFRPDDGGPVPVIASIGPYGKDVHWPDRYPLYDLVDNNEHMVWETPNPLWWVPRGFALVRIDTRGTGKSPGRLDLYGPRDAEDFHDVVEWAAEQPWSTGKVASSGISWLAMMGWRVAALQPPHLAAVIAWEGSSDFYRECAFQGGLYSNGFIDFWWDRQIEPQRTGPDGDDWREVLPQHPLLDDYHRARATDLDRVTVPVLSAANWGALHLHLRGNIEGWRRAASADKWLVVHTGTHIDPYYADWAQELQLRFLERYLSDRTEAMDGVPPVQLAIRHGRDVVWRDAPDFPLPGTQWRELYLGAGTLAWDPPTSGSATYPATFDTAPVSEPLELTGPVALRLWLTADRDDLDVFARVQHLDTDGEPIPGVGPQGGPVPMAMGWLKASHRETDPELSEPHRPWHPHDREVPLPHGEPTLLEVEIWPTSITLAPGERLRLELVTGDSDLGMMAHDHPALHRSAEGAVIHVGGEHASHLLVPVIPRSAPV